MSKKERKKDAILHCLLFGVSSCGPDSSEGVRKRQKLVILDVQSSCLVCSIIFPSSYLLEFDGKSPHPLSLSSLSLFIPLSLSLSPSMYMVIGWLFSQHWRGLNLLCVHPLWSVPCVCSFPRQKTNTTNCSNDVSGDTGLENQPWSDKRHR